MKKHEPALAARAMSDKPHVAASHRALPRFGVRGRVFTYFTIFTVALLALLWVFQIALLPNFYRMQKTLVLGAAIDSLASNIDNESLQTLSERIARVNDVSVLIVDEHINEIATAEASRENIIMLMNPADRERLIQQAAESGETQYRIFNIENPRRNGEQDDDRFNGHVPQPKNTNEQRMVAFREVPTASGDKRYVFTDTQITPIDATVDTLQSQYLFIAIFMVVLSSLLSLVLSRRIAQPIVSANEAAKGLALGRYVAEPSSVSYREIEQLNRTLTKAAEDLRRVEVMQRELIANISHDLRTPLTLIEGYAEAMRDLPGENTPANMQVIIDEAKRLTSLVNAVLEYSAMQNGQSGITLQRYNITQSIRVTLTRYQKLIEKEGFTLRFAPESDLWVNADETKIGQALYNLVNNALTYTGADKTVTVLQRQVGTMVHIEVVDTGAGIEPEELPHIWNRYYRGAKPHKRATVGSGLGLSIVKSVLDAHGLRYGVQSEQGSGTVFWFDLQLAAPDAPVVPAAQG